jgi:hypothetical protein
MSPCDDFRAQLPLFVGGDLEAPLAAKLQEHLGRSGRGSSSAEGCAGCSQVMASLEASRAELLDLPRRSPAPSVDLWDSIRATLAAEGRIASASRRAVHDDRPATIRRPPSWWRVASAAAATALLALGVQMAVRGSSPSPGSSGDDPAAHPGMDSVADQMPSGGDSIALPGGGVIQPVGMGGLRRLEPDEEPLSRDPFLRDFRGLSAWQFGPGTNGLAVDPSHPTLASDRLR